MQANNQLIGDIISPKSTNESGRVTDRILYGALSQAAQ